MILPIYIYGHSVLRTKCEVVKSDYPDLNTIIVDMFETMHNAYGVGISAPQIGLSLRIFLIDLTPYHDEDPTIPSIKKVFINPEIIKESSLIVLDTAHDGTFEEELYNYLLSSNWNGIIIADDIYLNKPMRKWWKTIDKKYNYDLTKYGHHSGTGLINLSNRNL